MKRARQWLWCRQPRARDAPKVVGKGGRWRTDRNGFGRRPRNEAPRDVYGWATKAPRCGGRCRIRTGRCWGGGYEEERGARGKRGERRKGRRRTRGVAPWRVSGSFACSVVASCVVFLMGAGSASQKREVSAQQRNRNYKKDDKKNRMRVFSCDKKFIFCFAKTVGNCEAMSRVVTQQKRGPRFFDGN